MLNPRTITKAVSDTQRLMSAHGISIDDWRVEVNHRFKRAYGRVDYTSRILSLHPTIITKATPNDFSQLILHEIAHILSPAHGHNKTFRETCSRIGCYLVRSGDIDFEYCFDSI